MSTAVTTERIAEVSPCLKARIAGVFYLLNILTGALALFASGRLGVAANLTAAMCYIAVTLLFYDIFKPVNRGEGALTLWLLVKGVNVQRWKDLKAAKL